MTKIRSEIEKICDKCKTKLKYGTGIGYYCPNKKCNILDDLSEWSLEDIYLEYHKELNCRFIEALEQWYLSKIPEKKEKYKAIDDVIVESLENKGFNQCREVVING